MPQPQLQRWIIFDEFSTLSPRSSVLREIKKALWLPHSSSVRATVHASRTVRNAPRRRGGAGREIFDGGRTNVWKRQREEGEEEEEKRREKER